MLYRRNRLHDTNRQHTHRDHYQQADINTPKGRPDQLIIPVFLRVKPPQYKEHQADTQYAIHTKQCRMSMNRCSIQALYIIQRNRRINRKTEDTRTQEVPETNRNKAVDRPLIRFDPFGRFTERVMLISLETNQHQRNDLQGTESGAQRQYCNRRGAEIDMMESS